MPLEIINNEKEVLDVIYLGLITLVPVDPYVIREMMTVSFTAAKSFVSFVEGDVSLSLVGCNPDYAWGKLYKIKCTFRSKKIRKLKMKINTVTYNDYINDYEVIFQAQIKKRMFKRELTLNVTVLNKEKKKTERQKDKLDEIIEKLKSFIEREN